MISNTVYKRSVLQNVQSHAGAGNTAASVQTDSIFSPDEAQQQKTRLVCAVRSGRFAVYDACNALRADRAIPKTVSASVLLPQQYDERQLQKLCREMNDACNLNGAEFLDIAADVNKAVLSPVVTAYAQGVSDISQKECEGEALRDNKETYDIVQAGYLGTSGMRAVIEYYSDRLTERFSEEYIKQAAGQAAELSIAHIMDSIGRQNQFRCAYACGEGGIFAALWHLGDICGGGLLADFQNMLVRQETIEICEFLDINPYELSSLGCLLVTSCDGYGIVELLKKNGVDAAIIGHTTTDKAKRIRYNDNERFVELPRHEELERVLDIARR